MRRRGRIILLLLCLLAIGGGVEVLRYWRNANSAEAIGRRAGLDCRIPELEWNDLSLQSAVDQLCRLTGARIQVSDQISSDVPSPRGSRPFRIRAHLRDVTLSTALELLADAAPTLNLGPATYEVRPDGSILLLTGPSAERIVHVYDVRDLLTDPATRLAAGDPLERALHWAVNQSPVGMLPASGRWAFVGTRREHARIVAALEALRSPPGTMDSRDESAEALAHVVGPIHVHGMPLASVIDTLGAQAGINVVMDWDGLLYLNITDPGRLITVDFERLPLRAAINLLLGWRLVFAAGDHVLFVTPRMPPISLRQVRSFEVSDLTALFSDRLKAHDFRPGHPQSTAPPGYYSDGAMDLLRELAARSATVGTGQYHAGYGAWSTKRLLLAAPADAHWELRRIFKALREFADESGRHPPARPRFLSDGENVFALLNTPVRELSLNRASLVSALASLQSAAGVTIGVDAPLSAARDGPGRPITLHLWNVPLSQALREVLKAASDSNSLGYGIDQGVIIVSADPYFWATTRIYDVSDLALERTTNLDQLAALVKAVIDTKSWRDNGGYAGMIQVLGNWLIVSQTPENHRRISELLLSLRDGESKDGTQLFGR